MCSWRTAFALPVLTLAGCASWNQTQDDVYRRLSGDTLKPWLKVGEAASLHWPYAWAAVAAYQDEHDPSRKPPKRKEGCPEAHAYLKSRQWELWESLPLLSQREPPKGSLAEAMRQKHLRVEVWSNRAANKVIVAFGGTAFSSLEDWKSNFRWVLRPLGNVDAYNVLTDAFVPAFRKAYIAQSKRSGYAWLRTAELGATGHSLGGGLAQRFAYSLLPTPEVPRVWTVYAFNPSPVSGKREVPHFRETAKGLLIYRIYNRGETLAGLRSLLKWGNPGDRRHDGQTWIDLRYRSDWSWRTLLPTGTVRAHGMVDLACFMKERLPVQDPLVHASDH